MTEVLITVCTACDGDAKAVRRGLKRTFKAAGAKKRVRVIGGSCLDLCPKRAVALAVASGRPAAGLRYLIVAGDADPEKIVAEIERAERSRPSIPPGDA